MSGTSSVRHRDASAEEERITAAGSCGPSDRGLRTNKWEERFYREKQQPVLFGE